MHGIADDSNNVSDSESCSDSNSDSLLALHPDDCAAGLNIVAAGDGQDDAEGKSAEEGNTEDDDDSYLLDNGDICKEGDDKMDSETAGVNDNETAAMEEDLDIRYGPSTTSYNLRPI